MIVTVYRVADGAVVRVLSINESELADNIAEGQAYVEGDYLGQRIDPATGDPVPLMVFAVTVTTNTVSGIPTGTRARVGWVADVTVDDGALQIEVELPENVPVHLTHPLYSDLTVEVPCEGTS